MWPLSEDGLLRVNAKKERVINCEVSWMSCKYNAIVSNQRFESLTIICYTILHV